MDAIVIRSYKNEDRSAIRKIAYDTAFMGESAEVFFSDKEKLADILTAYFTDYEPESAFVAEAGGEVAGYLIGAKDTALLERVCRFALLPKIISRVMLSKAFLNRKNIIFIYRLLLSLIKGEFRAPDFTKDYPAVLHINLAKEFRGHGIGSMLITHYLSYLKGGGITGVHLATMSTQAPFFFEQNGFTLLYKSTRSYFRNILHRDITCYIYGRKLA